MSASANPDIVDDGLVFLYDTDDGKSYKGEPTTNLITSNGIDFSTLSSYSTLIRSRVSDSNSPSGYACEMEYPDGGVNTASRITFGDSTNIPTSGNAFVSIMAKFQGGPSSNITPRVYSGSSWQTLAPLDGGSAYLTSEYRRFGVYAYLGTGSGGPLPAFSMTQSNSNNQAGQKTRWHSPQVELKTHATPFVNGTRSATQGLIDRTGDSTIDLSNVSFNSNEQMTFDGTDDYVSVPSFQRFASDSDLTIEAFVKPTSLYSYTQILGRGYSGAGYPNYYLRKGGGSLGWSFFVGDSSSNYAVSDSDSIDVNVWQHVVGILNRSENLCKIYVNGLLKQTADATGMGSFENAGDNLVIGKSPHSVSYSYFAGDINTLKLYNKALTSTEVLQNYNAIKSRFSL